MKKFIKGIALILTLSTAVFALACCNKAEPAQTQTEQESQVVEEVQNVPKDEQTGTAGSQIPLKDNHDEADYQIQVAMQYLLEEAYGDKVNDARVYVEKIYTSEEEQAIPELKERNLGPDEVAFEVKYELHPAEGTDVNELTAATGTYDEETGWILEKYNLGILRPNDSGDREYKITDFGTGW